MYMLDSEPTEVNGKCPFLCCGLGISPKFIRSLDLSHADMLSDKIEEDKDKRRS